MFKRLKIILAILIFAFVYSAVSFSDDEVYTINYTVKNNSKSTVPMNGVSLPKENINVPDFVQILDVTPTDKSDIQPGASKDFAIKFKMKDVKNNGAGVVTVRLKYDPNDKKDQCITPSSDTILVFDQDAPKDKTSQVIPQIVTAEENQNVYINNVKTDSWSGVDTDQTVTVSIQNSGETQAVINPSPNENDYSISGTVQSPSQEGTYDVFISNVKDNAGNEAPSEKIGTVTVLPKKPDNPSNPDESFDVYFSTLTHIKAPHFGLVKVAILKTGYVYEMSDLLATFGETSDIIAPQNFSPDLASKYSLLIIPSAGLSSQAGTNLRDKLSEYVNLGGNLIVMTQPTDTCYHLLPEKVESLGYFQDKACYMATAGIRKYNYATSGQTDTTVDGTADGVITAWPDGAETWLYRLKNNFPALISYKHGKGRVIVSNYYSDYAHGHSQLNQDEKNLLRDLLSWGRDFTDNLPEILPGDSASITVPVNYLDIGGQLGNAMTVRLILRTPDRKLITTQDCPVDSLAPGGSVNLSYNFNDQDSSLSSQSLGIWWINYEILDADGNTLQAENEGQRVALSKHLEGQAASGLAVTVSSPGTTALEGAKIPFQIVARNDGDGSRRLSYKVFSILGSSSGQVSKEQEVDSGTISLNAHDSSTIMSMLDSFKAYASSDLQSWAKNWWQFEFYDENGKCITTELRSIGVYKPSVKVAYELRNLTNTNAVIFKPGDKVGLDLMLQNFVPVGYPVHWEIAVKANNQGGRVIYQQSGDGQLDPVINSLLTFNVPEDCTPDCYQVETVVTYNGTVIPLMKSDDYQSGQLSIDNFNIHSDGIYFDLHNNGVDFANYVIISRVHDLQGEQVGLIYEDSHNGVINGQTVEQKHISIDATKLTKYGYLDCFIVDTVTAKETWFGCLFKMPLHLNIKSCQQDLAAGRISYNLAITNPGIAVSGAKLKVTNKGTADTQTINLPDFSMGETINVPVIAELSSGIVPNTYPISFIIEYNDGTESIPLEDSPKLSINRLDMTDKNITVVLQNGSQLASDFQLAIKLYDSSSGDYIGEFDQTGLVVGSESQNIVFPIGYINPFKIYRAECTLKCPSYGFSNENEPIYLWIQPCKLKMNLDPMQQTINNSTIGFKANISNLGQKTSELKLRVRVKNLNIVQDFDLPNLETNGTYELPQQTIPIPESTPPGTYSIQYSFLDGNGSEQDAVSGSFTILPPKLLVMALGSEQLNPGDKYGISIYNVGNQATDVTYDITLFDSNGSKVATQSGTTKLQMGGNYAPSWSLPLALRGGNYVLNWVVKTTPIPTTFQGYQGFSIAGSQTQLTVTTNQSIYNINQNVLATSQINYASSSPLNGKLDLTVKKLTTIGNRIDGWPCIGGNNERTGATRLTGSISQPIVSWTSEGGSYLSPLVGNLRDNNQNEVVGFTGSVVLVIDGSTGVTLSSFDLKTIFPDMTQVIAEVLCDVNNDGYQEIVVCADGKYVAVLDGNSKVLWSKVFDDTVLDSPFITSADLNGDGVPELLLSNVELNAATGEVLRTGTELGTIADVNNDGKLEIVTKDVVLDSDFQVLASRSGDCQPSRYPVIADLNHSGKDEIILFDSNGIYVYDSGYQLLWSYPIQNIETLAVADINHDGKDEIVATQVVFDRNTYSITNVLLVFSSTGELKLDKSLEIGMPIGAGIYFKEGGLIYETCSIAISDINNDGQMEILLSNLWNGITAYDANGSKLWNLTDQYGNIFPIPSPLAVADVDGDGKLEVLAQGWYNNNAIICIDDSLRTKEPAVANPTDEVEVSPSLSTAIILPDGELWSLANTCNPRIVYYNPSTNITGYIPLIATNQSSFTLQYRENKVEVWDSYDQKLLGVIDPVALTYTEIQKKDTSFEPINPKYTYNGFKYKVSNNYQMGTSEIIRDNIETNETQDMGSIQYGSVDLVAVLDENHLVIRYFNRSTYNYILAFLSLIDMQITPTDIQPYSDWYRLNDSEFIFSYDNNIYKYDYPKNQTVLLLSSEQMARDFSELGLKSDQISISLIPKDEDHLYIADNYYSIRQCPWLLQYTISTNKMELLNKFKAYGSINYLCSTEDYICYTYCETGSDVYVYDKKDNQTLVYHAPSYLNNLDNAYIEGMMISHAGKILLTVHNEVQIGDNNYQLSNMLVEFDPTNGTWSLNPNEDFQMGDENNATIGGTDDVIYSSNLTNIYAYHRSTKVLQTIDQGVGYGSSSICFDNTTNRLYYILDDTDNNEEALKYYDELTGQIVEVAKLNGNLSFQILGIKDGVLYLSSLGCPNNLAQPYESGSIIKYSIADNKFSYVSSVSLKSVADILHISSWWTWGFDGTTGCFDSYDMKYRLVFLHDVLEFDLNNFDLPIDNTTIEDGSRTIERVIKQESIPIQLDAGASQYVQTDLGGMTEPGTYVVYGQLSNELGQSIAEARTTFFVQDGTVNLSLDSDKAYSRPGETVILQGQLRNMTTDTENDLRVVVTRSGQGQPVTMKDETISLAAGETYGINLTDSPSIPGAYQYTAEVYQGGTLLAQCIKTVMVSEPTINVSIDAPDYVGSAPFTVAIRLENPNPYPISGNLNSEQLQLNQQFTLQPGEQTILSKDIQSNADTLIKLNVTGDVTATCSKAFTYGEHLQLGIPSRFAVENGGIPCQITNNGRVNSEFPFIYQIYLANGELVGRGQCLYYLEVGQTIQYKIPMELVPGDYRMVYTIGNSSSEAFFTCLSNESATLTAGANLTGPDELTVNVNATNNGFSTINGYLDISSGFTHQTIPVQLDKGVNFTNSIVLNNLPVQAGTYQLIIALISQGRTLVTQTVTLTREAAVQPGANIELESVPADLVGGAGQDLSVTVKVKNNGGKNGDGIIELSSDDLSGDSQTINLDPGVEQEVTLKTPIPDDYETGTYQGKIIVNGKETAFKYQINGYKLNVTASLDKPAYQKGELAKLTLNVQNLGGQSGVPLTVRVKHGDFDETREITLGGNTVLTFDLPADVFDQKVFYGFYHTGTGRSLLLDVCNMYQSLPELMVTTDKQRYQAGETVTVTTRVNQEDWLGIAGPGDFHQFEQVSGSRTYAIPLPGTLQTGTYSIWVAFAGKTLEYKIDVLGHDVRFVSGNLDQTTFQGETPFNLKTILTSSEAINTTAVLELVKPDGTISRISSQEAVLGVGENAINFNGKANSDQVGTHWLRVSIFVGDVLIGQNDYAIQFGKEELLGVTTTQAEYRDGTEPVKGELQLYGQGTGIVTLQLDGQPVGSIQATLNGSTTVPYNLSGAITPGPHTLSATYQGAGMTGTVTTKFKYGTGLPDLQVTNFEIGKDRNADGTLPVSIDVQKLNDLPAKNIKVQVKFGDGVVGEYAIDELSELGDTYHQDLSWDSGSFQGAGAFTVTVNSDNSVLEYDTTNNSVTQIIVIPAPPLVSGLSDVTNNPSAPISGTTSPNALVFLYNDQGVLDLAYADDSGNFVLNNFSLQEGQNNLRLMSRSKEGWNSKFTDPIKMFVDSAPPQIEVTNISDGQFLNYSVTPNVYIEELNPDQITYLIDGQSWTPGTAITAEGLHQLSIKVVDQGKNEADHNLTFTIDCTPPSITVSGVPQDGGITDQSVTPITNATDANMDHVDTTLNGEPYNGDPITESGDYELVVTAYDKAGNTTEEDIGFSIKTDNIPPVTLANYPDGWVNTQVGVTLSATDADSGVKDTFYRIDGGAWTSGTSLTIDTEGTHTVDFYSVDQAGNTEPTQTIAVKIDKTAPVTNVTHPTSWMNTDTTVNLDAVDPLSGVKETHYRVDGGAWAAGTSLTIGASGTHTVEFYSIDQAGNTETTQKTMVSIDKTAPVTTAVYPTGWTNTNTTVSLTATDAGSGVKTTYYRIDGSSWNPGTTAIISTDGTHTFDFYSVDQAGNIESAQTITVKIDKAAPITTAIYPTSWTNTNTTVTLAATDTGSGVKATFYRINGGSWSTGTMATISTDGTHTFDFYSVDQAGNTENVHTVTIKVDKTAPVTIATYPAGWINTSATITLAATDVSSSVKTTYYRIDGGSWSTGTTATISTEGTHAFDFYSTDQAGNTEIVHTITVKIDKTAPVSKITLTGDIQSDGSYKSGVSVTITASDGNGSNVSAIYYHIGTNGTDIAYTGPFTINQNGTNDLYVHAVDFSGNSEAVQHITFKINNLWSASYSLLCDQLTASGNVTANSIFSNGSVTLSGNCQLSYLGTVQTSIQQSGNVKILTLQKGLANQTLPTPDWTGLTSATTLRTETSLYAKSILSNVRYEHDLQISGQASITGLLVVKGNLTISGNVNLDNVGIFCTGKITISGNTTIHGLVYAGNGLTISGNPTINGAVIVKGLIQFSGNVGSDTVVISPYTIWLKKP